ncbi:MAG: sigma-70 family RNA polymerase sigma factor [Propionibacteriaceae bacterium]|nr:sigma-70 family RNA polymerase sigma factor [Propionibacteriaceae bacterium]
MIGRLPEITLTNADEVALAKRIEAGWYAEHLLHGAPICKNTAPAVSRAEIPREELVRIAADGAAAWQEMFIACLRLVRKLAARYAKRNGYDIEDTFQAGCVILASALQNWDYRGEARLITYIWRALERRLSDYCCTRGGHLEAPAAVVRAGLAASTAASWQPPKLMGDVNRWEQFAPPTHSNASDLSGLLQEVLPSLSPLSLKVLSARHGLGEPRLEAAELASHLHMGVRTLRRLERQAETELRNLLNGSDAELSATPIKC